MSDVLPFPRRPGTPMTADDIRVPIEELRLLLDAPCSCEGPRPFNWTDAVEMGGVPVLHAEDSGRSVGSVTVTCANCIKLRQFLVSILFTEDEAVHLYHNADGMKNCMDARCSQNKGPCQSARKKVERMIMGCRV